MPVKAKAAKGHTKKHARAKSAKHSATAKHHPKHHALSAHEKHVAHMAHIHAKAAPAKHAKARALSLGDVACCTTEALGLSLRLQGFPVSDRDILGLFRLAGGHVDAGAPILAALEAASEFTLAGYRPVFEEVMPSEPRIGLRATRAGLILGADLPGPHAVVATPDGWWSWGTLWCPFCDFPDAVIEEAWAVTWAVAA